MRLSTTRISGTRSRLGHILSLYVQNRARSSQMTRHLRGLMILRGLYHLFAHLSIGFFESNETLLLGHPHWPLRGILE